MSRNCRDISKSRCYRKIIAIDFVSPEQVDKKFGLLHFIGIGGIGMSGIAEELINLIPLQEVI